MKKILIADDEPELREAVMDYLKDEGFKTYQASNGTECLKMIEEDPPNLVLLDIRMPGMDGLEVLRRINEKFPNIVVIVISGTHDIQVAKEAIRLGACDYITKPVSLEMLHNDYINRFLG